MDSLIWDLPTYLEDPFRNPHGFFWGLETIKFGPRPKIIRERYGLYMDDIKNTVLGEFKTPM